MRSLSRETGIRAFANRSEHLLAEYLMERGVPFEYEAESKGKRPDFWLKHPSGEVVCEVREVSPRSPAANSDGASCTDPYRALRQAINEKRAQGAGVKGKYPYVLVLRSTTIAQDTSFEILAGAMFGDLGWVAPLGLPEQPVSSAFLRRRKMGPDQNTRFSAVAVLREFNADRFALHKEFEERRSKATTLSESLTVDVEHMAEYIRRGLHQDLPTTPFLMLIHNPWAAVPLPTTVFNGPRDQQYRADADGRLVLESAEG